MLMPKKTKYRKPHRIKYEGKAKGNTELQFGKYGLMAKEGAWITAQQIKLLSSAITHYMRRGGNLDQYFPTLS